MGTLNRNAEELTLDDMDMIVGGLGLSSSKKRKKAYCKVCGAQMQRNSSDSERVSGGSTAEFVCLNTNYKGTGKNCPEFNKIKYSDEVDY